MERTNDGRLCSRQKVFECKLATCNVRGLCSAKKQYIFLRKFLREKLDLILLTETKLSTTTQLHDIDRRYKKYYHIYHSTGKNAARGVAILIKTTLMPRVTHKCSDGIGNRLTVCCETNIGRLNLTVIYAPNDGKARKLFFQQLQQVSLIDFINIVGGDFNCTISVDDRLSDDRKRVDDGSKELQQWCDANDMHDLWARADPRQLKYTYIGPTTASRIDYIYGDAHVLRMVQKIETDLTIPSDHAMLRVDIKDAEISRKNYGKWFFNSQLLNDAAFVETVQLLLRNEYEADRRDSYWWDDLKLRIKRIAIRAAARRKRRMREKKVQLEQLLQDDASARKRNMSLIRRIKMDLQIEEEERLEGQRVRTKTQMIKNNEKPGRWLKGLEKRKAEERFIKSLYSNGEIYEGDEEIEKIVYNYYRDMYGKVVSDRARRNYFLEAFRRNLKTGNLQPSTSEMSDDYLSQNITTEEILHVIKSLTSGKTPGNDGLTADFYKYFKDDIARLLQKNYEQCLSEGRLTHSQRMGEIILVPKTANEEAKQNLTNWRPITLLNTDYKILAKILANRLKSKMNAFIGADQKCGVVGRTIHEAIDVIQAIYAIAKQRGKKVLITKLDFEKAFDRVDHEYLWDVLYSCNIDEKYFKWIKTLYTDIYSQTWINGVRTTPFRIQRSVRQGCPLSMFLFTLSIEPLLETLRQADTIQGFQAWEEGKVYKTIGYADDTYLITTDVTSLLEGLKIVQDFCETSGAKINLSKSQLWTIGRWSDQTLAHVDIPKEPDGMKVLGVYVGSQNFQKQNWADTMEKIEQRIRFWSARYLSIFGRATVWNTYILSLLWYRAKHVAMTKATLKRIERTGALFIWRKRFELRRRSILYGPPRKAGTGLLLLGLKMQIMQAIRYRTSLQSETDENKLVKHLAYDTTHPQGWYRSIRKSYEDIEALVGDARIQTLAAKDLYAHLLSEQETTNQADINSDERHKQQKMCTWLYKAGVEPYWKTVMWKLIHNSLPTGDLLFQKGFISEGDALCSTCRNVETIEHIFFACAQAQAIWEFARRIDYLPHINMERIKYHSGLVKHDVARDFLCLVVSHIWDRRNDRRFQGDDSLQMDRLRNTWERWKNLQKQAQ